MRREKQIDEMASTMLEASTTANVEPVLEMEGKEVVLGENATKILNNILEQAYIPFLAETLYNAGYRRASDVAEEIFAEIEKRLAMYSHIHRYAEEANKVTEEYANGDPVEMTSVWDACRLEHNGYDDYETMCQLQDNIGNIAKSSLLKEIESDIAQFKKKYTKGGQ